MSPRQCVKICGPERREKGRAINHPGPKHNISTSLQDSLTFLKTRDTEKKAHKGSVAEGTSITSPTKNWREKATSPRNLYRRLRHHLKDPEREHIRVPSMRLTTAPEERKHRL